MRSAVSGSTLTYITNTASPATSSQRKLTSPTMPNGTLVTAGSTQVRLSPVSNAALFLKSTGGTSPPSLGAADEDMVPFDKYAQAAEGLGKASSAARALFAGANADGALDRFGDRDLFHDAFLPSVP